MGEAGHGQGGPGGGAGGVHGAVILLVRPVTHNVNLLLSRIHDIQSRIENYRKYDIYFVSFAGHIPGVS